MNKLEIVTFNSIGCIFEVNEDHIKSILLTKNSERRELTPSKQFFDSPKFHDYFIYEEGKINSIDAVLRERASKIGIIEKIKECLVTLNLDNEFKNRFTGFNMNQHVEQLYENEEQKPREGDIVVYREGKIFLSSDEPSLISYSYRTRWSEREFYVGMPNLRDVKAHIAKC